MMLINKISNPFGKLFYITTNLRKEGRINDEEKGRLKDLIIKEDKTIMELLNTYNWSQNLQGLENNMVDCVLKKKDELEEIASPPSRSPDMRNNVRNNSKKPSRVVVPNNRLLSFYNNAEKPANGIFRAEAPIKSMPAINMEEDKFNRKENHSPSLQVLPTYSASSGLKEVKSEMDKMGNYINHVDHSLRKNHSIDLKLEASEHKEEKPKMEEQKIQGTITQESHERKKEAFQVIITDVRGRSKTTSLDKSGFSGILKNTKLETIQSESHDESSARMINTASLPSGKTKAKNLSNQIAPNDSERSKNSNSLKVKVNHSVENTPASRLKDSSVVSGNRTNNQNDNVSRRERSLSAFTDESYEPCGFNDYYKQYKKDNDIPPSELGDFQIDASTHLKPPQFGLGISRRNTVEVNHVAVIAAMKTSNIPQIEEQMDENASPQDKKKSNKKIKKEGSFDVRAGKGLFSMVPAD